MALNTTAAYPVAESSQVAEARRAVLALAHRLDFGEEPAGRAALVVTELATNLVKHARGGEILMRSVATPAGTVEGLEVVAVDKGPGIADFALSRRDGQSTSGSLGHGLGAIERQADDVQMYTHSSGTATVACIYCDTRRRRSPKGPYEIGAVQVSKPGEAVCGDAWSWRMRDERLSILVADGLGHGLHAHEAATACVRVYEKMHEEAPATVIGDVHAALRSTRGAAVAMTCVDIARATARFAGLGNIAGTILSSDARHNMISQNGTAGHSVARIQEFAYPVPRDCLFVIATDGLGTHWDLNAYPGLRTRSPGLIAAILYRDFSRRRDDVTVIVAKDRTLLAAKG